MIAPSQLSLSTNRIKEGEYGNTFMQGDAALTIAIVGFGPKGFYALERIITEAFYSNENPKSVHVSCFNANPCFATGPNYDVEQPEYMMLNYPIGRVQFWSEDHLQLPGEKDSLVEFVNDHNILPEINGTEPCSRNLVGAYFIDIFNRLCKQMPNHIGMNLIQNEVKEILVKNSKYFVHNQAFDAVICTTGHAYIFSKTPFYTAENYIPNCYPISIIESLPTDGKVVAVQGLGLTFIDVVLALTEGSGGTFSTDFTYLPSGKEPKKIYPYSGSGQMMLPRGPKIKDNLEFIIISEQHKKRWETKKGKLDWDMDIFPILKQEYEAQFQKYADKYLSFEEIAFPSLSPEQQIERFEKHVDAFRAVGEVWRVFLHQIFGDLYAFGGLTAESQKKFDSQYLGLLNRLSFGMPEENFWKIKALWKAGILDFSFSKSPKLEFINSNFSLTNEDGMSVCADFLINARIAKAAEGMLPVYENLIQNDIAEKAHNGNYYFNTLQIDNEGKIPGTNIVLQGTPTEQHLLDNESLSRECYNFTSSFIHTLFHLE